ncbi:Hypothetical protein I595_1631 [Croceitalea dokdonensis DOKDO 023]|uniref:Uncharacterized protein n=1 Tax=Croceitalea dokdonensis DOKDO 023 TaxID=1300341 RepID=A0A0P7AVK5_9FLAO|nr:Hypothetical protein I595_1631 [Croceitalea dokdonensis DOKDO 023]
MVRPTKNRVFPLLWGAKTIVLFAAQVTARNGNKGNGRYNLVAYCAPDTGMRGGGFGMNNPPSNQVSGLDDQ